MHNVASPWCCQGGDLPRREHSERRLCIPVVAATVRGDVPGASPTTQLRFASADVVYAAAVTARGARTARAAVTVGASELLSDVVEALFAQQEACAAWFASTGADAPRRVVLQANQQLVLERQARELAAMRFTPATLCFARSRLRAFGAVSQEVRTRMLPPYM